MPRKFSRILTYRGAIGDPWKDEVYSPAGWYGRDGLYYLCADDAQTLLGMAPGKGHKYRVRYKELGLDRPEFKPDRFYYFWLYEKLFNGDFPEKKWGDYVPLTDNSIDLCADGATNVDEQLNWLAGWAEVRVERLA